MSRIGKKPVAIPSGVTVTTSAGSVAVKGPKGELSIATRPEVSVNVEDNRVMVNLLADAADGAARAYHGLTRALIQNMVTGVTAGYERKLEIHGVGYNATLEGNKLVFNLGFAHAVSVDIPKGLTVECPNQTTVIVRGCDKQQVGELAARIRKLRPPEPYKGKGIKYDDEIVHRKAGKAFGSA
ncbi:MAG: 50S ribosomal protein L6 [Planctomycetota bacterium]|jgi:large subunit ribosomal protein L6